MSKITLWVESCEDLASLQRKLDELEHRAELIRAKGSRFRHISSMLDDIVAMLRAAVAHDLRQECLNSRQETENQLH